MGYFIIDIKSSEWFTFCKELKSDAWFGEIYFGYSGDLGGLSSIYDDFIYPSQKAVAKRIKSGKMSDQQLANLYHAVARANQGSNFQAIFSYGLFYRSHAKQSDAVYELYRAEMAKRNLL